MTRGWYVRLSVVVPAKAGTHTPQSIERLRSMGPGPRFARPGRQRRSHHSQLFSLCPVPGYWSQLFNRIFGLSRRPEQIIQKLLIHVKAAVILNYGYRGTCRGCARLPALSQASALALGRQRSVCSPAGSHANASPQAKMHARRRTQGRIDFPVTVPAFWRPPAACVPSSTSLSNSRWSPGSGFNKPVLTRLSNSSKLIFSSEYEKLRLLQDFANE